MSGTVNISRRIWSSTAFKPEPFTEREAFMWIIMEASYKGREKRVGNIVVNLDRGQLATSVRFMCEAWGWSKSRVDRFLKRLENRDMIGTESGTGINVITVCKYDDYQNKPNGSGTPKPENRDSSGTAAGQQRDKPNKGLIPDEIQGEEKSPNGDMPASDVIPISKQKRRKPELPLPEGWTPDMDKARNIMAAHDLTREEMNLCYQSMEAHAHANDRRQRDWDAAYRNWCLSEIKYGNIGPNSKGRRQASGGGQSSMWD